MPDTATFTSRADVATDNPARYAKQLGSHLGRRLTVLTEDTETRILFDDGECRLICGDNVLHLSASASSQEVLERVEHVVGRHLERFGARAELVVTWVR